MKLKPLVSIAMTAMVALAVNNANAYAVFTGADGNSNPNLPLTTTPLSTAAETAFKSHLVGVGTETFETRSGSGPLALNFGAAGTATLTGNGSVASITAGSSNAGRYSVPGGTRYWETNAGGGNFQINFSQDIAAFGFYGIDIGDFGGTLALQFLDDANNVISSLNIPSAASGADGSVLYFGAIAANDNELFKSIRFISTQGNGDVFAFDSFTIGAKEQVTAVPEPTSIALLGLGLMGCALARRKSAKNK